MLREYVKRLKNLPIYLFFVFANMKFIYHRAKNYDNLQKYVLGYYLKYSLRNRKSTIIRLQNISKLTIFILTGKTYSLFNYLIGHNFRVYIIQWSINCTNNALKPVLKTFIQMCTYPLNLFDQACAPIKEREILNAHDDTFWYIGLSYHIKLASHREKTDKIKWNEMMACL